MTTKPEISKMLTLSIGRVSKSTISALENENEMSMNGFAVYDKEGCGFIIYVPDPEDKCTDLPYDLQSLLRYAQDLGCDVLCLDSDSAEEAVAAAAKDSRYDSRTLMADAIPVPKLFVANVLLGEEHSRAQVSGIVMAYTEEEAEVIVREKLASVTPSFAMLAPWTRMHILNIKINQPLEDTFAASRVEFVLSAQERRQPMTTKSEISKMLTLSTGHVSKSTISALENENEMSMNGLAVYDKEGCGFIIYVPDPEDKCADIPCDLQNLLQYAKDLGCDVLCLDSDGPKIPYLMWYEDKPVSPSNDGMNLFSLVIRGSNGGTGTVERFYTKLPDAKAADEAARRAVQKYLETPDGEQDYTDNNDEFNWGDVFNNMPKSYFEQEGLFNVTNGKMFQKTFETEVEHDEDLGSDFFDF